MTSNTALLREDNMISLSADPRTERIAQLLNTKLEADGSWEPHEFAYSLEMDFGKLQKLFNEELLMSELKLSELRNIARFLHLCTIGLLIKIGALQPDDLLVASVHYEFDPTLHSELDRRLRDQELTVQAITR